MVANAQEETAIADAETGPTAIVGAATVQEFVELVDDTATAAVIVGLSTLHADVLLVVGVVVPT
jgi:hypothetical protein